MHFEAMRSKLTVCDHALLQASHPPWACGVVLELALV
jgi:hypothetical protein